LADVLRMADERFGLRVSAGAVPVSRLVKMDRPVLMATAPVSPWYDGPLFSGGGSAAAECRVKQELLDYVVRAPYRGVVTRLARIMDGLDGANPPVARHMRLALSPRAV
jgi:hypothetical protein